MPTYQNDPSFPYLQALYRASIQPGQMAGYQPQANYDGSYIAPLQMHNQAGISAPVSAPSPFQPTPRQAPPAAPPAAPTAPSTAVDPLEMRRFLGQSAAFTMHML